MKKLLIISLSVILSGCFSVAKTPPVKQPWPGVTQELLEACPDLKNVPENTSKLSGVLEVVVENYKQYHECRAKVDDWILWYKGQKEIHDGK